MRPVSPMAGTLAVCAVPFLAGCTLVGFGIGALSDRSNRHAPLPGWQIEALPKGRQVLITTRDGQVIGGRYDGVQDMGAGEYASRYAAHRARAEAALLPDLGPGALVSGVAGKDSACDLVGFTSTTVVVRFTGRSDQSRLPFEKLHSVRDAAGRTAQAPALQQMVFAAGLPLLTHVSVRTGQGTVKVAMEDVVRVDVPGGSRGRTIGAIAGAVVDAAILIAVAHEPDPPPCRPDDTWCGPYSCPYVYSFDGTGYRLDSETFAGAIHPRLQRTDVDNLDHIRAVDGLYRLKVTSELRETDYVDETALLVADHAQGSRVIPASDGTLHAVGAAVAPLRAHDLQGRDVHQSVAVRDDDAWISNPIVYAADGSGTARDGLIVEFARPAEARSLKLIVRARNTSWSSDLFGEFLALHGAGLEDWYGRLASSASERARFRQAMVREAALRVAAWDGRSWRDRGAAWIVGPAVPKEQVVVVDLAGLAGDRMRLRLDSTPGFWAVDSVAADFSVQAEPSITERLPASARAHDGSDLTPTLRRADGDRFVMRDRQHWAEVSFVAPPLVPGGARSVLLRTSGYYVPDVRSGGPPQPERIAALLDEPGAFGRYAVARARQRGAAALTREARAR